MSLQALKKAHDAVLAVSRKVDALCAAVDALQARVAAMEAHVLPADPEKFARDVAEIVKFAEAEAPKRRGRPPKEAQA